MSYACGTTGAATAGVGRFGVVWAAGRFFSAFVGLAWICARSMASSARVRGYFGGGRASAGCARFTSIHWPSSKCGVRRAASTPSAVAKRTKPKPRLREVARSIITTASRTSPNASKCCFSADLSTLCDRPPTNTLLGQKTISERLEVLLQRRLVHALRQATDEHLARAENHLLLGDRALQVHLAAVDGHAGRDHLADGGLVLERHEAEAARVPVALHHHSVHDLAELPERVEELVRRGGLRQAPEEDLAAAGGHREGRS